MLAPVLPVAQTGVRMALAHQLSQADAVQSSIDVRAVVF